MTRAADIRNYDEMGALPILLAVLLASAAVMALLVTLVAAVRARRRDFAVIRTLGFTTRQIRASLIVQTFVTMFIVLAVGLPIGVVAGRLTWIRYAGDIGVITTPTVPFLVMLVVAGITALACALFALIPAALASRASTAHVLRTE